MTESPVAVSAAWMPPARMQRIIVHWTAGAHKASDLDKAHYHILIQGDASLVRGIPTIDLNQAPAKKGYAAHTLNCNTGSIGVSLCCMAGAIESPFNAGKFPMTEAQWDKLPVVLAALCERYNIIPSPTTVLSHAEVQTNLGIKQRGKWDIARLAFDPSVKGAKACGDIFRKRTAELMG
jgi:N-acetyl-anhydromuramyl-L-alanine amidase AmpD